MPDVVINRVNPLGKDQPKELVFTDRKGRLIGDVQPTGVEGGFKIEDQTLEEQVPDNELAIPTKDEGKSKDDKALQIQAESEPELSAMQPEIESPPRDATLVVPVEPIHLEKIPDS